MAPSTRRPTEVSAFAPATVANLGPGFDVLGLALEGPGDTVVARLSGEAGVRLASITGDGGRLPRDVARNTAAIAAAATLARAGVEAGVELELRKGMPLGSGMGSSAASAAAAAVAVNLLVGAPLRKMDLVEPCLAAEEAVSGRHADNVSAAILGGMVLVRSLAPLDVVRLPVPEGLRVVVVTPALELPTRRAREVLPERVPLGSLVKSIANVAGLVSACHSGDLALLARSIDDDVATPARAALIPGALEVMEAARRAGGLGASISGAGPSIFALCRSARSAAEVAAAMAAAFDGRGVASTSVISSADAPGARRL